LSLVYPSVTSPAPARCAERATSTAAPGMSRLPQMHKTRPASPLCASSGNDGAGRGS
jgi:hypothetical protein